MVNQFALQRLWIKLKTMLLLVQSSNRLVHDKVTVLQNAYLYIDPKGIDTQITNIKKNFIKEKKPQYNMPFSCNEEHFKRLGLKS